jgi:predicted aspartyl protease
MNATITSNCRAIRFLAILLCLFPSQAFADGNYRIGIDSGGMYFQTDHDGGWQIPKQDRVFFKVGETGRYTKGRDTGGAFINIENKRKFYIDVGATGDSVGSVAESVQKQPSTYSGKETKVTVKDNQVIVPVTLGYRGIELQVSLLLDTGASITTVNRDAVKKFQLVHPRKARLIVPGGKTIDADLVQLSYIKVGPHKIANLHAGIIDQNGGSVEFQGLLGMNFLKEVIYTMDFQKQVITWR